MNLHDLPAEVLPTKAQLQALEANVFADRQQAKWEEGQLDGLPKAIRAEIVKELRTRQLENLADGNRWMLGFLTKYRAFDLPFNASDDDIDAAAARKAKRFAQLLSDISTTCPAEPLTAQGREWCHHHGIRPTELRKAVLGRTPEQMVALLRQACRTMGAEPPKAEHLEGLVARLTDRQWWIRTLRTTATRNLEELARELRQVSSRRGLYTSAMPASNASLGASGRTRHSWKLSRPSTKTGKSSPWPNFRRLA